MKDTTKHWLAFQWACLREGVVTFVVVAGVVAGVVVVVTAAVAGVIALFVYAPRVALCFGAVLVLGLAIWRLTHLGRSCIKNKEEMLTVPDRFAADVAKLRYDEDQDEPTEEAKHGDEEV